ncbi:MAG: Do family serine endopeptidase [Desulfobacterales bacterium]|nr:Do family serine endopeptidase [Desulfobacterales bacterium]
MILFQLSLFAQRASAVEDARETPVVRAVKRVSPAVVNISTEYEVRARTNPFSGYRANPFFDSFFKDFFDPEMEQKYQRSSLGSGVIIDGERGFVLTNAHVIAETGAIKVILKDEREFEAQIVGADSDSDLAVLKIISDTPLPDVKMGNSDDLMIGETVIAIGNPFGFSNTVTTGVISALDRSLRVENSEFHNFIQTDASINPGNSGGPLLNINGALIGINTAIYAKAQGIGFALPINRARRIVFDLIKHGEVIQSWIGVMVQPVDEKIAQYLHLSEVSGVMVRSVASKGPADSAGINVGDVLIALGQRKLSSSGDFQSALHAYGEGDQIPVKLIRDGKIKSVQVRAALFPLAEALAHAYELLGIKVENLSRTGGKSSARRNMDGVMITEISNRSYLAHIGARPGDIIRKIDDITIHSIEDFKKAIARYHLKPSLVILLQREDALYHITIKL